MATNVTLDEELYKRVMGRAGAENMTPKNERDMAALGVTEGDIDREIEDYRLGR
jgi:hypothetical protein